jgi:beta-lactamase regulating signal transducer with metallopeptidase domain
MNTLLAALINGFVVSVPLAAVVWLALAVSRRWVNAATRYAVWSILLALVVCLPFRYVPLRPSPQPSPQYARIAATSAALPAAAQPPAVPPRPSRPVHAETSLFPLRVTPGPWSVWIMAVWAIVAFFMLLRLLVSYAMLWRMKRQANDAPEVVAACAQSALDRLGVTRRVRMAVVKDAVSPMVAGPFHPTILLPAVMLESMDEAEIEQICLHEAAHLARRDDWALMVQRLVEAVFAPHPLVRWVAGRINLEREIACDDLVISVTGSARPYAACLTRIAELAAGFSSSPAAAAVSDERSHLTRRVETLLDKTRHTGARLLGARLAVLGCGLALVTFLAARTSGVVAFAAAPQAIAAARAVPALPAVAQELIAQTRPATRPPAPTPAGAAEPATQAVRIAVSVTDPLNRFVAGLEAGAFHIFENGVEDKIIDFTPQKQPVSVAIVWDETSELRDLRNKLAQLRNFFKPEHPEVRAAEARITESENRALPSIDVPGSQVFVTKVGENQSLADGLESAIDQLRGTPAEQAAIVLVFGPASWTDERTNSRINAAISATGVRVYALGLASVAGGTFSTGGLPILVSGAAGFVQYPVITPDRAPAGLAALTTQLANQYVIRYVPSGPAEPGKYQAVDVRLTPPVGLPQLTARVASGYYDPRDRR